MAKAKSKGSASSGYRSGSYPDQPKYDQAEKLFKLFGGARRLGDCLECVGVYKSYSTVYRWGYSASNGGTDGIIPYKVLKHVGRAAENASIKIPAHLLLPRGL